MGEQRMLGGSLRNCQVGGMLRKAFVMSVRAGCETEYERRHNPIWAELAAVLREHGVRSYSIFLEAGTGRLFGYVELEDEARWEAIAQTAVCRRWWAWMKEIMPAHADGSPVSEPLREVFHLEADLPRGQGDAGGDFGD